MKFQHVCLTCFLGAAEGHTEHSMVRFVVDKQELVVHDITEATDDEIKGFLTRAFGEPA